MVDRRERPTVPLPGGQRRDDLPEAPITVNDVVQRYGVNRKTVLKWIGAKLLPAVRLPNGQYRIERDALIAFHRTLHQA